MAGFGEVLATFMVLIVEVEVFHQSNGQVVRIPVSRRADFKESRALTGTPLFFDTFEACQFHLATKTVPTLQSLKPFRDPEGKFEYKVSCVTPESQGVRNPLSIGS